MIFLAPSLKFVICWLLFNGILIIITEVCDLFAIIPWYFLSSSTKRLICVRLFHGISYLHLQSAWFARDYSMLFLIFIYKELYLSEIIQWYFWSPSTKFKNVPTEILLHLMKNSTPCNSWLFILYILQIRLIYWNEIKLLTFFSHEEPIKHGV